MRDGGAVASIIPGMKRILKAHTQKSAGATGRLTRWFLPLLMLIGSGVCAREKLYGLALAHSLLSLITCEGGFTNRWSLAYSRVFVPLKILGTGLLNETR